MNILFDARCILEKHPTGVSYYAHKIAYGLFEQKIHNVRLFTSGKSKKIKKEDAIIHASIPNKLLNTSILLRKKPQLESMMPNTDILLAPNINFIALKKNTKFILTIHDLSFIHFPEFYSPKDRLWHTLCKPKELIERADKIICVSQSTKKDVQKSFNIPSEKINVIYPGLSKPPINIPPLRNIPKPFIFSLSTIEPRKNILRLFKAFQKLIKKPKFNSYHLILAGPLGYKGEKIINQIYEMGLSDKVHYVGYVPSKVKYALMKSASLFVYPSLWEGFGFPPLEAASCGTPVIASSTSSIKEVLGNSALLINPYRVDEIEMALDATLSDKDLQTRLITKGYKNAQRFNWDKCIKETIQICT